MQCSLPQAVIHYKQGGISELLSNGHNGFEKSP
jgi:hypothetical protein